ncbi:hypothetical protein [Rhizobium sp. N4311]|uniref:hypothetical protein n=1 Tax=Rhizobium sp. N4311 TaxID=1703972 RepID=UPI000B969A5C|nr:hypothetical protein [Rhizobium sp. N4311]
MKVKTAAEIGCVDDDAPLSLRIAAELAFPDGSMTEGVLKTQIKHGKLAVEIFGKRIYTTLNNIKRMRELCRANHLGSASTSASAKVDPPSGLSSTDQTKSAQDALQRMSRALIERSNDTSRNGTSRTSGKASLKP